jgi:hypothetical protein
MDFLLPLALTFGPLTAGGLIAYGRIRSDVNSLQKGVEEKASQELVEHQYEEIISRLGRIEDRIKNGGLSA